MKIALLINKLTDGGAERVASLWAKGFYERGYQVVAVIKYIDRTITYKIPFDIKLVGLVISSSSFRVVRLFKKTQKIRNILKEEKPDVIISIDFEMSLSSYIASIGLHIPIIHTAHNAFERPRNAPMPFMTKIEKFYLNKLYDCVTVLSQADKDVIGKRLNNIYVLPNPLTYEPVNSIPAKEKIVLAVGRLDDWYTKGFDVLLKAWQSVVKSGCKDWKLIIAGNSKTGKGQKFLEKMSVNLNIPDSVSFVGYQEDMLPYYQKAAVFVLSSRFEGFGMVLIEAMSQGCACVACDYKGRQREIINHDNVGLICKTDDVGDLSSAITKLITDESLRVSMGIMAVERSDFYSLTNTMNRWEQIFEKL